MNEDIKTQLREKPAVGEQVINALQCFINNDRFLLEVDANEPTLTSQIGRYLQDEFPDYNVDCEYNRNIDGPKKVYLVTEHSGTINTDYKKLNLVVPDIIVHKRGNNHHNLLVVEFKKSTNNDSVAYAKDRIKLEAIKHDIRYTYGLFIELETNKKALKQPDSEVKNTYWI
ncbi:hypothetical protein QE177_08385 [Arsenophonus sp. aPb]|uniref:hypothetical protein n=1 Tax=Arsenophonus sp. aPb TaxID=3041619 RepID=UPI002468E1DE|nr:hypothetical protein [Arsenophonus sp. aPb]WGL97249.1 hypothetical protein QE177_08385 [Arsenophonus sp. aPb]